MRGGGRGGDVGGGCVLLVAVVLMETPKVKKTHLGVGDEVGAGVETADERVHHLLVLQSGAPPGVRQQVGGIGHGLDSADNRRVNKSSLAVEMEGKGGGGEESPSGRMVVMGRSDQHGVHG